MSEYLERKAGPTVQDVQKRLADIAIEQMLLSSERLRLQHQLQVLRIPDTE